MWHGSFARFLDGKLSLAALRDEKVAYTKLRAQGSALLRLEYVHSLLGRLAVIRPTVAQLERIDGEWSERRSPHDVAARWVWAEHCARDPECFAVVGASQRDEILALWCGPDRLIDLLRRGLHYRMECIEVNPLRRGESIGTFAMTLVGARALELDCVGVVFGVAPSGGKRLEEFYKRIGATDDAPGWNCPSPLLPFSIDGPTLRKLGADADALVANEDDAR
jgi:hypothetical protein